MTKWVVVDGSMGYASPLIIIMGWHKRIKYGMWNENFLGEGVRCGKQQLPFSFIYFVT